MLPASFTRLTPWKQRPCPWLGAGLQQGDLTQASPRCEVLELLTQLPPAPVPWRTLAKDAAAESSGQIQRRARHTTWQAECISLCLTSQPGVLAQGTTCTTALGRPEWEVREGGMGTAGRLYGTQTPAWGAKLALSALIHPHPLRLARSAVCERGPVRNTGPSGPTPSPGTQAVPPTHSQRPGPRWRQHLLDPWSFAR